MPAPHEAAVTTRSTRRRPRGARPDVSQEGRHDQQPVRLDQAEQRHQPGECGPSPPRAQTAVPAEHDGDDEQHAEGVRPGVLGVSGDGRQHQHGRGREQAEPPAAQPGGQHRGEGDGGRHRQHRQQPQPQGRGPGVGPEVGQQVIGKQRRVGGDRQQDLGQRASDHHHGRGLVAGPGGQPGGGAEHHGGSAPHRQRDARQVARRRCARRNRRGDHPTTVSPGRVSQPDRSAATLLTTCWMRTGGAHHA